MKKILITGGCGFIGSNLSIFLKKKGFIIFSLDNLSRKGSKLNLSRIKKLKIKNYNIDIQDTKKILKLPKFDIILDCSALVEAKVDKENIKKVFSVNFFGTNNLLMKSVKDKSKIIFFSTSRVYSVNKIYNLIFNKKHLNKKVIIKNKHSINEKFDKNVPNSFYGLSKKFSEDLIKEYSYTFGIKYLINRFGVISGPWQFGKVEQGFLSLWIWKHLNKKKLFYKGFGGKDYQVRDVLHIDDLCSIVYLQIKKLHKINNYTFNIGGGKNNSIDLKSLTNLSEKITKNKIKIQSIKSTDISDIPLYISNNNRITKHYKWKPTKKIPEIALDVYNWQLKNFNILKKFMK